MSIRRAAGFNNRWQILPTIRILLQFQGFCFLSSHTVLNALTWIQLGQDLRCTRRTAQAATISFSIKRALEMFNTMHNDWSVQKATRIFLEARKYQRVPVTREGSDDEFSNSSISIW